MSVIPEYLRLKEGAAYLQLHPRTFSGLLKKHPIRTYCFGDRLHRIRRADLEAWAARHFLPEKDKTEKMVDDILEGL
ncbi:MAG: helix-turn-helix domain-containing protein [Desulfatiglandales bacterium]|nr:helix-turn-helix domain-containing protein [Desulfatiglandales bacterium]